MEVETSDSSTSRSWVGTNVDDICNGKGRWSFVVSPIVPSKYHCVTYNLPVNLTSAPKPHCNAQPHHWDDDHVPMPYSNSNLFPVKENNVDVIKSRWKIITNSLSKQITTSRELETAICSYHGPLPEFSVLHYFFEECCTKEESINFFSVILPRIIKLALRLPEIVPGSIPLLRQNHNRSISMSQLQISCLLANAFLCTFPWKKNSTAICPGVNFVRLFAAGLKPNRVSSISEKMKCICNYFRRVTEKTPLGIVTFERKFIPGSVMPRWDNLNKNLGNVRVHICSSGKIEEGLGLLQVDFANKNIGGGVLGYGCVQEEIRFVICPELIVSRLFVEQLGNGEAVIITGAEMYNSYTGYSTDFEWAGDIEDSTPFDVYGRRRTSICVIDATHFSRPKDQFNSSAILRELNKAYVGFSSREKEHLAPVATGNWGCGAFGGSKQLKTMLQLMACCAAGRDLVYYSFGDEELREDFYKMYTFLAMNNVTIAQLWRILCRFSITKLSDDKLYSYIQQAYFDSKKQPMIKKFFTKKKTSNESEQNSKSSSETVRVTRKTKPLKRHEKEEETMDYDESSSDEVIPSSQPGERSYRRVIKRKVTPKVTSTDVTDKLPDVNIAEIFDMLDGNGNTSKEKDSEKDGGNSSLLSELDKFKKKLDTHSALEEVIVVSDTQNMEVDDTDSSTSSSKPFNESKNTKKKITDYFRKEKEP